MTYEQFWRDDATIAQMYLKSYKINREREEIKIWKQGMYTYEALCDVSPVLHAFCKSGTKPLPYPTEPYGLKDMKEDIENENQPTKQEVENERLKAQIFFDNWAKATTKHFNNER